MNKDERLSVVYDILDMIKAYIDSALCERRIHSSDYVLGQVNMLLEVEDYVLDLLHSLKEVEK